MDVDFAENEAEDGFAVPLESEAINQNDVAVLAWTSHPLASFHF